jgi:ribosomal protein S18 acetylase RimI-like enzyme
MYIRVFRMEDYDQVIALWTAVGLDVSRSDSRAGLAHKLERDADLFLVAKAEESSSDIIGVVMGSYDGRRGWINHLAVAPANKGHGLGRLLMAEVERRLRAKGCAKVNLLIEPANVQAQGFYERLGYNPDALVFMEKRLS